MSHRGLVSRGLPCLGRRRAAAGPRGRPRLPPVHVRRVRRRGDRHLVDHRHARDGQPRLCRLDLFVHESLAHGAIADSLRPEPLYQFAGWTHIAHAALASRSRASPSTNSSARGWQARHVDGGRGSARPPHDHPGQGGASRGAGRVRPRVRARGHGGHVGDVCRGDRPSPTSAPSIVSPSPTPWPMPCRRSTSCTRPAARRPSMPGAASTAACATCTPPPPTSGSLPTPTARRAPAPGPRSGSTTI